MVLELPRYGFIIKDQTSFSKIQYHIYTSCKDILWGFFFRRIFFSVRKSRPPYLFNNIGTIRNHYIYNQTNNLSFLILLVKICINLKKNNLGVQMSLESYSWLEATFFFKHSGTQARKSCANLQALLELTDYGHTMANFLILCGPNSKIFGIWM